MLEEIVNESISEEDAELLQELADGESSDEAAVVEAEETDAEAADPAEEYLNRIAELEEKLRLSEEGRAARERELECLSRLREAGLPSELLPVVLAAPDMAGTVDALRCAVKEGVEAELLRRCRSDAPLTGGKAPLTKEELMRLPVAELQRLRDMGTVLAQ